MIYRFKLIVPLTYKDVEVESEEVDLGDQEIALIKQLVKFVDDENDDGGLDMDCVDYLCKIPEFAK